jgi:hypothetical protein
MTVLLDSELGQLPKTFWEQGKESKKSLISWVNSVLCIQIDYGISFLLLLNA